MQRMMEPAELYARVRRCLGAEIELFGSASKNARVVRFPGVLASVSPATPDRSLFNSVQCDSRAALENAYDELVRMYQDAGVRAFTVWTDPGNAELAAALEQRGHRVDSQPWAMAAEIDALRLPRGAFELDWVQTRDMALIAALNDAAYGFPSPAYDAALDRLEDPRWGGYAARLDGKPVSCLLLWDGDYGDAAICAVATLPEARGRGIATHLLARALDDAKARGIGTTSLQASPQGQPIYAKLGYRDLGRMTMWERRWGAR
jgi:ribosomal protein S18 acetylase RimI-like enzyme